MAVMTPIRQQVLVLLRQDAPMAEVILILLRVHAVVRGPPLLAGLSRDAQPLASLLADWHVGALGGRLPTVTGQQDVTAAAEAGVKADKRARLQRRSR
jgi:hypothetical protein